MHDIKITYSTENTVFHILKETKEHRKPFCGDEIINYLFWQGLSNESNFNCLLLCDRKNASGGGIDSKKQSAVI